MNFPKKRKNTFLIEQNPFDRDFLKEKIELLRVFNVGHGNSIVVSTLNCIWIVDFGTSGGPTRLDHKYHISSDYMNEIVECVLEMATKKKYLIIVISHFDNDHYNKLELLLDFLEDLSSSLQKHWIIPSTYVEGRFKSFEKSFVKYGLRSGRFDITDEFIFNQDPCQTVIFLNNPTIARSNENHACLVVKFVSTSLSVVITGDATFLTYKDA